jgi:hypothetical protein
VGYRVEVIAGEDGPRRAEDFAAFLAGFVRDGELPSPGPGEDREETWRRRLGHWWAENPFRRADSPLALTLEDGAGHLVGFHAFIPRDYVRCGQRVPGLIASTFFVRERHRAAVLGMFLKIQRLARTHHVVDGTPTEAVQEILKRFGFARAGEGFRYLVPVRQTSWGPRAWAVRGARLGWPCGQVPGPGEGTLLTAPEEVESVADGDAGPGDDRLRPFLSPEVLRWEIRGGSVPRRFFGWRDREGVLRSWLLATEEIRKGWKLWRVGCHGSSGVGNRDVAALIAHLAGAAEAPWRPADLRFVEWPVLGDPGDSGIPFRKLHAISPPLFFSRPASCAEADKECLYHEGDTVFL